MNPFPSPRKTLVASTPMPSLSGTALVAWWLAGDGVIAGSGRFGGVGSPAESPSPRHLGEAGTRPLGEGLAFAQGRDFPGVKFAGVGLHNEGSGPQGIEGRALRRRIHPGVRGERASWQAITPQNRGQREVFV
jgi:hypothetical protein